MATVLIFYPKPFNSYSKFSRKLLKILSNLVNVDIVYQSDPNRFIEKYAEENQNIKSLLKIENWVFCEPTHAIIFDDGEEFPEQTQQLQHQNIPLRFIKISITRVININRETEYKGLKKTAEYEYIGRGSYWGNPYSMFEEGEDREEVIRKFKYDFDYEKFPKKEKKEVYLLAGKRLGCFCKPDACHGDVLADFLNSWDDGK